MSAAPPPPLLFSWDGESMRPMQPKLADRHFVCGEKYVLAVHQERSMISHAHQFAWLADAWKTLPEGIAELYPSPEHLRKRALIQAGYYDEEIVDAGSNAAALRVASAFRHREEFSLVIVRGHLVFLRTAKSQARGAMLPKEFQASKTALMQIVADLIGVEPKQLEREAGKAA